MRYESQEIILTDPDRSQPRLLELGRLCTQRTRQEKANAFALTYYVLVIIGLENPHITNIAHTLHMNISKDPKGSGHHKNMTSSKKSNQQQQQQHQCHLGGVSDVQRYQRLAKSPSE
jgi:protoporphyrinogen oxidase